MTQQQLTYIKLGLVAIALTGGFVLVGVGRLDASAMYQQTTTMVGALVVALGLASAGAASSNALGNAVAAHLGALRAAPVQTVNVQSVKPAPGPGPGAAAVVLPFLFVLGLARLSAGCGGTLTPQQSTDITIGINAAACVIEDGATDLAAGMQPPDIIADLVKRCGVTVAQIATLLDKQASAEAKVGNAAVGAKFAALATSARSSSP